MVHTSALLPGRHPGTHGGFNLDLKVSSGVIDQAEIEIGLMHRGAEKLLEYRDVRQGAMLANRHIWSSPTAGEYAYVLAAEELLGLQPSPRADALRAIYCEIDRIISHLTFLAYLAPLASRERWADFMEAATGARMHHQVIRIGGVAFGLDENHFLEIEKLSSETKDEISALEVRGQGIGVLTQDVAASYGVTGPIARASGIEWDERMRGYGWYQDFQPVVNRQGDAASRFTQLVREIEQSLQLISGAKSLALSEEELLVKTPKTIRLPEGHAYAAVEGALGSNGISLYSDAGKTPQRARLRTASLSNIAALQAILPGQKESDLPLILASWPFLAGDSDR